MIKLPSFLRDIVEVLEREKTHKEFVFVAKSKRWENLPTTGKNKETSHLSSSEVNRRLKKYAKSAGLDERKINTRVLRNTQKVLSEKDILEIIEKAMRERLPKPILWKRDPRLHGINRRLR